jgi:hypothetical protein
VNVFDGCAKAKPINERAIPQLQGTHTIEDIALMVGSGALHLWVGDKSAVLTEFIQFPRMKIINCFIGAGEFDEVMRLVEAKIIPFARQNGCSRLQGGGRDGWRRKLDGYSYGGIYMHKDI